MVNNLTPRCDVSQPNRDLFWFTYIVNIVISTCIYVAAEAIAAICDEKMRHGRTLDFLNGWALKVAKSVIDGLGRWIEMLSHVQPVGRTKDLPIGQK